jgi:hypothetical protein
VVKFLHLWDRIIDDDLVFDTAAFQIINAIGLEHLDLLIQAGRNLVAKCAEGKLGHRESFSKVGYPIHFTTKLGIKFKGFPGIPVVGANL